MTYRLGVDIGGTFTDFAVLNEKNGQLVIHKQLTTPEDPSRAVLDGIRGLLEREQIDIQAITAVVHGTTLVTNAMIERKGARTGMITTAGFSDVLDLREEKRYDVFDLRLRFPEPLIPRWCRAEVSERCRYDGSVQIPLDETEVRNALTHLVEKEAIESLAICLLHSYANPTHEIAIKTWANEQYPQLYISTSSEVFPDLREFARWTTTCMNAYTQPMFARYLERIERGLKDLGLTGTLYIMTSSGGTVATETARSFPVRMLESGPAAGVLMSAFHGQSLSLTELLSFDMGGTTAKGALIRSGKPLKTYEMEVARVHQFKRGSGFPAKIPVIDMIEIGAGGGSIAHLDRRGLLAVGPRSAGANPGPVCYGQGGEAATLTDANLILGFLDPTFFLGGELMLESNPAREIIQTDVATPLNISLARAAWGIHDLINEEVARAFRIHASEHGFDYRQCSMVAFGGSGPIHALRIASKLKISHVVFPVAAGVMSALGLLASPLSFEMVQAQHCFVDDLNAGQFESSFAPLVERAMAPLLEAGIKRAEIDIEYRLDMRYYGQGYTIEVTLPEGSQPVTIFSDITRLFSERYATVYAFSLLDAPLEITTWKVEARGPSPTMIPGYHIGSQPTADPAAARKGSRPAYFPEQDGYVDCPVYDRYLLANGSQLKGPALVEERESTLVIGPGNVVTVDNYFNMIASPGLDGKSH